MPGASETAVQKITEIVSSQKQSSNKWKKLKTDVFTPFKTSFDTIALKKKDGTEFPFLCANPTKTLEIYGVLPEFNDLLLKTAGQELHLKCEL